MKKILIPTDLSTNSLKAFDYCVETFGKLHCEITFLHVARPIVVDMHEASAFDQRSTEALVRSSTDTLTEIIIKLNNKISSEPEVNFTIKQKVEIGIPTEIINSISEEINADLIILSTIGSGHSAFEKIVGTISSAIISNAVRPVILVPTQRKSPSIDQMIFCTDMDSGDPYELDRALKLLAPLSPVTYIAYVKDENTTDARIAEFSKYILEHSAAIQTEFINLTGPGVEDELNELAVRIDAELVVMVRKTKKWYQRLFNKSKTRKMLFTLEKPLLVLN